LSAAESLVSVIVPVRDDTPGLRELIRHLEAQTLPRAQFEVVVGDDGSEPRTLEPLIEYGHWVRVESGPPKTSYAARNRAVRAARGDVLAFCDSDCLPEPTWLEEGLLALQQADLVAGEIIFVAPSRPTVWSLLTIDMFLDQERNVLLARGVTANLFIRRTVFEQVGGFDESFPSGGDYDFVKRAVEEGAELAYAPAAVVRHPTINDSRTFLRKVWTTNRWSAARRARAGAQPDPLNLLTFVPILGTALARRNALRPAWKLQRQRLRSAGLLPRLQHELRALPVLYFIVAYVAGFGRVRGWLQGRRLAREWTGPGEP
jgi:glycosyltransferase involved in cell wall biosynthesis